MVNRLKTVFLLLLPFFSSIFYLSGKYDTSIMLPSPDPTSCYRLLKDQVINPEKKLILLLSIIKRKIKGSLLPSDERFLRLTSSWLGFNLFTMEYLRGNSYFAF